MSKLLEQAREMHERHQRQLAEMLAESTVGEGRVRAKMNGHRHLLRVAIDSEALKPADRARLEDLLLEAINDVTGQIEDKLLATFGRVSILPSLIPDDLFDWDR